MLFAVLSFLPKIAPANVNSSYTVKFCEDSVRQLPDGTPKGVCAGFPWFGVPPLGGLAHNLSSLSHLSRIENGRAWVSDLAVAHSKNVATIFIRVVRAIRC